MDHVRVTDVAWGAMSKQSNSQRQRWSTMQPTNLSMHGQKSDRTFGLGESPNIRVSIVAHPATGKTVSAMLLTANDATSLGPRAAFILNFGLQDAALVVLADTVRRIPHAAVSEGSVGCFGRVRLAVGPSASSTCADRMGRLLRRPAFKASHCGTSTGRESEERYGRGLRRSDLHVSSGVEETFKHLRTRHPPHRQGRSRKKQGRKLW